MIDVDSVCVSPAGILLCLCLGEKDMFFGRNHACLPAGGEEEDVRLLDGPRKEGRKEKE